MAWDPIREEISQRLQQARQNAGFDDVATFCEQNEIPLEQYTAHEKGEAQVKASQAVQYSKLFNVSLTWLMTGIEDGK